VSGQSMQHPEMAMGVSVGYLTAVKRGQFPAPGCPTKQPRFCTQKMSMKSNLECHEIVPDEYDCMVLQVHHSKQHWTNEIQHRITGDPVQKQGAINCEEQCSKKRSRVRKCNQK